jgi:hypothetical protein
MINSISGTSSLDQTSTVTPPHAPTAEAKAQATPSKDQVNISKLAQKLASDGDTQAQEVKESGAENASEKVRNKA